MADSQASVPSDPESVQRTGTLPHGTRIEEFEIERVMHQSATGVVYLTHDHALDRTVALKEYWPANLAVRGAGLQLELRAAAHADAFERGRQAFISEARVLAQCDHPSLLRVHRVWEANGTVYRVMPHYPGENLLSVREGMSAPPDEEALRALLDALLAALETLHGAGQVHGDVSPENVLLLPDDRPVLLDFGAVRRAIVSDRVAHLMAALGSAPDAPRPEFTAQAQDASADLRALAALARFCISGEWPAATSQSPDQVPEEPIADLASRRADVAAQARYSQSLRDALGAMQAAQPGDPRSTAAHMRGLLRPARPQSADGRIEPVLNPVLPASPMTLGPPEPELVHDAFMARVHQAIATTVHHAKTIGKPELARPRRGARPVRNLLGSGARRMVLWFGGILVALAFGVAGWELSERLAADATAPAAAEREAAAATPPFVGASDRHPAVAAAPPGLAPQPQNAGAPTAPPAAPPREAAAPTPARDANMAAIALQQRAQAKPAGAERPVATPRPAVRSSASPREECGARTEFSLYRCMQTQCALPRWTTHPQCARLRASDEVD